MTVLNFSETPLEKDSTSENLEISEVLSMIDQKKNQILEGVGNIGYTQSIDIWEEMREKCSSALAFASTDTQEHEIRDKIKELEGLEILAFTEKISETVRESGWKESQEVYTSLLSKLKNSTLQESIKQSFLVHLHKNLEITQQNIQEKEFIANQEKEEDIILKTLSYKSSLPKWREMIKKYENKMQVTPLQKYKNIFQKKIIDLQASLFLAETYSEISDAKDMRSGKNWKDSVLFYKKLKEDTNKIVGLKEDHRKQEKSDLMAEISNALEISEINSVLKEKNFYLLQREENLLGLGYRESKNGWKKTRDEYKNLLLRSDIPEKYREIFQKKEKEMDANFEEASFHELLENQKEGSDSWEISLKKYTYIQGKAGESKKISKMQKAGILEKVSKYIKIAEANTQTKTIIEETTGDVANLLKLESWKESHEKHIELRTALEEKLRTSNPNLLDEERKKEISEISNTIATNIETCSQEMKNEKLENSVFSAETVERLCAENPKFSYLYTLFLSIQFQKTDPKILEQKDNKENREIPDTEISTEQLHHQQLQELQVSSDEQKTHTIDISDSAIDAISDVSRANTSLEYSVNNSIEISLVNTDAGVVLNSPSSQNKRFSKALLCSLSPEISRNFNASQIETFLSQASQNSILKSQIID